MELSGIFKNISPLDHRYYLANRDLYDRLALYLSEEASVRYCIQVEIALLATLIDESESMRRYRKHLTDLDALSGRIEPEEIYEEESRTHHNIRALVNVLKRKLPDEIGHLVHLGATSADILDTATSMRMRDVVRAVLLPLMIEVETALVDLSIAEAETPQIGRTHGQHAVPTTCGYAFAEYASRFGKSIERLAVKSQNLRGKLAGAVGAYNATSLIVEDPETLEKRFLGRLGLQPSEHATQIVEPEYLLDLLLEINISFGILANLADDLRNLQRSEIGELRESFAKSQVGSSTMPQKRNPWNSEHVKSLWKAFCPRIVSMFMDQISEHQRDLSNSASSRFVADFIGGFAAAVNRMKKILGSLYIDRERMLANLRSGGEFVLAEALYILLSLIGETEAHEILRQLTLEAEQRGASLITVMRERKEIYSALNEYLKQHSGIGLEQFCRDSEAYRGLAATKAKAIALRYRDIMKSLSAELEKSHAD